jgi:protein TonB
MTARAIALLDTDDRAQLARWVGAGAIVLAAHAGVMAAYLLLRSVHSAGSPEAPAIIVDLAPMPVAPASPADVDPGPEVLEVQQPPPDPVVEAHTEPVIEPAPPKMEVVELPPPPPPSETPVVALPEPPPLPPEVKPEPTPPELPPEVKKAEPKKPPPPRRTAAPRSERTVAQQAAAPSPGAGGVSIASWRDLVIAQLQRAKRYPAAAEARRAQGVATVSFTLSRGGGVLSRSLVRSSGNSDLDQEALAMINRAAPFPPFPSSMPQASVHLSLPVNFAVR